MKLLTRRSPKWCVCSVCALIHSCTVFRQRSPILDRTGGTWYGTHSVMESIQLLECASLEAALTRNAGIRAGLFFEITSALLLLSRCALQHTGISNSMALLTQGKKRDPLALSGTWSTASRTGDGERDSSVECVARSPGLPREGLS